MPLSGRKAALKATAAAGVASTNNAATRSTGVGGETGYIRINSTARRHWDNVPAPVLYRAAGGSTAVVSSTNYTVNYVQGRFQWKTGDPSTGTYTIDVDYLTASQIAGGREWQLNVEADMFEVTEFGSSGWKNFLPNLKGATVTINRYWNDPTFLDHLTLSNRFLMELIVNAAAGWRYEGFVRVASDQIQTAVDAIISESITLNVDGQVYFST
jgi:hypothetical protein